MRLPRCRFLLAVLLGGLVLAAPAAGQQATLGTINFPTSGSKEAQEQFLRGTKYIHSFEFDDATDAFLTAQKLDPNFAMAYWGEAMSYNHPLWAEQDLPAARKALAKLGATRQARAAKAPTPREKGFMEAVEILFGDGDKLARDIAYAEAMRKLSEQFPEDREAAAFYALSILGTMRPGGDNFRKQMMAGAIAQELFRENPNHPGAAHYVIHAFDDPIHAPLALRAANLYATIAPDAAHAQHMPAHIFVQRGMWKKAADSNKAAYQASVVWAERRGLSPTRRDFHSLSWLQYTYLQLGDLAKAKETIDWVRPVAEQSDASRAKGTLANMNARYVIETQEWQKIPVATAPAAGTPAGGRSASGMEGTRGGYGGDASVLLAAGMSAARTGDLATAEQAVAALKSQQEAREASNNPYSAKPIAIMRNEVAALVHLARKENDQALKLLKAATEIETTMDPPSGPPEPMKPSHELYGEVLLELNQPKEAAAQFEEALLRMPNRTQSLLGAARAAAKSGDKNTARLHYSELAKIWGTGTLPALQEAKRFLTDSGQ